MHLTFYIALGLKFSSDIYTISEEDSNIEIEILRQLLRKVNDTFLFKTVGEGNIKGTNLY